MNTAAMSRTPRTLRTLRTLVCSALPLLIVACAAVGPDRSAPAVAAPSAWSNWHGGDASLQLPAAASAALSTQEQWASLLDPTLQQLLAMAAQGNQDLASASLRVLQARALETTASAQRGPQVSARAGASRQRLSESGSGTRVVDAIGGANREQLISFLSDPYSVYQAGFDASWELDLWGRVRRSVQSAQAQSDESRAALQQLQLTLAADVVRAYRQLRGAQARRALLAQERESAQDAEALSSAQFRGGLTTEQPVLARRQRLQDLQGREQALTLEAAVDLNRLTVLCGQHPGALNELLMASSLPSSPVSTSIPMGVPSEIVRQRPDVGIAEARLAVATASIGVAMADLYPRITIGASFGFETVHEQQIAQWGARQWSIGPSLSLPIFDHGRRRATVLLRELQQQEAAVVFQQTVLRAWHEVDDAISAYASEAKQLRMLEQKLALNDETLALAKAQYDKGVSDYLPVLDAEQASAQARQATIDSTTRLHIGLVAVYKSLGNDGTFQLGSAKVSSAAQPSLRP